MNNVWTGSTLVAALVLVALASREVRLKADPTEDHRRAPASNIGGIRLQPDPAAPSRLSDTGLYERGSLKVDARNRAYSPQYPLWSDGAHKQRWIFVPPGAQVDATDVDAWVFPVGTKFWKEFTFNGRRIETRFLWRARDRGWVFASYRWNDDQSDATLAPVDGEAGVAELAPGRRHSIPSVEDCHACHDSASAEVLGFNALQLSTDRDPNAIHGEPLAPGMATLQTLLDEGVLKASRTDLLAHPPRIEAGTPRTRAVLGYLSTNCGVCHNGRTSLAELGMLLKQPSHPPSRSALRRAGGSVPNPALETTIGQPGTWRIPGKEPTSVRLAPGSTELSALLYRMKSRRPSSQMPPLGSVLPDQEAIDVVTKWIEEDLAER